MKKTTLILVSILTALQIGCATQSNPVQTVYTDRPHLVAFGDSVSYCILCFPGVIAKDLKFRLDNRSVPGSQLNSFDQLGRLMEYQSQPNDIIVFLTGFNDVRAFGNDAAHLAEYQMNLRTALASFKRFGNQTFIGTTEATLCVDQAAIDRNRGGCVAGAMEAYVQVIKDEVAFANAPNIHLVDVNAEWVPTRALLLDDVHPTEEGHRILADIFLAAIRGEQ